MLVVVSVSDPIQSLGDFGLMTGPCALGSMHRYIVVSISFRGGCIDTWNVDGDPWIVSRRSDVDRGGGTRGCL